MTVKMFFTRVREDRTLQAALDGLPVDDREAALNGVVAVAAAAGYAFTREELESEMAESVNRPLEEHELEAVAGGGVVPCNGIWSISLLQNVYGSSSPFINVSSLDKTKF